jgi:2-C-methyl-D-erythritol 4-phosphate cytidylyltransferase
MSSTSTLSRCGTVAILLAAGEGLRSGGRKQFRKSGGRSILRHAAEGLAAVREVGGLMVVVPEDAIASVRLDLASLNCPIDVVAGGTTRNESSRRGMAALPARCRWVLIHDAARPFASQALVRRVLVAARKVGAAIPAVRVADSTVELGADGSLRRYLPRERLGAVQTPQAFSREGLDAALASTRRIDFTDDASVVIHSGKGVAVVEGEPANIKITTPAELSRALRELRQSGRIRG